MVHRRPPFRVHEWAEFYLWFRRLNARRTLYVGLFLTVAAVITAINYSRPSLDGRPVLFGVLSIVLGIAVFVIYRAQAYMHPRTQLPTERRTGIMDAVSYGGELVVVGIALFWMFVSVIDRIHIGFGLAEFLIGTLGLALLRLMRPRLSIVVYPTLALLYGYLLHRNGIFEFEAWFNAVTFSVFAIIWSWGAFNARVLEFRNVKLVEELAEQNERLATMTVRDSLTDLFNRRYYNEYLETRWADEAARDEEVVLVLLDIDHFKEYNDRFGHPQGDVCLQDAAGLVAREVRESDAAVRLGGEEFGVILSRGTADQGVAFAERLRRQFERESDVKISCGVAAITPAAGSPEKLYQAADEALYRAKKNGRNRVEVARSPAAEPGITSSDR